MAPDRLEQFHGRRMRRIGAHDRRERARRNLREEILAAAREIAREQGWTAVTIRRVAERVKYSPPMIYEHFQTKDALLSELVLSGHRELRRRLRAALDSDGDSQGRFMACGLAYWTFARESPELYQVMHGFGGVPFGNERAPEEAREVFGLIRSAIEGVADSRGMKLSPEEADDQAGLVWSWIHGLLALTMSGRIPGEETRVRRLFDNLLDSAVRLSLRSALPE